MMRVIGVLALILLAGPAAADDPARLAWLEGCWRTSDANSTTEEHWMAPAAGTMVGMGRTVAGGKTVQVEFMQIRQVDDVLAFIALPSGQAETVFPLKSLTEGEAVFENPAHDFPQRVIYRRNADGSLTGRIEGQSKGRPRSAEWPYARCR
jgi:hypothetical protein